MPRFENKELAFDVPEGWEDRSVISFEAPRPPGKPLGPNLTLMRLPMPAGQSLTTFATQQVASLAASLPKFELVEHKNTSIGAANVPAVQVLFHWQHPDGALTQRVTMFLHHGTLWSFAATGLRGDLDQTEPVFDKLLRSFVLHGASGPAPAAYTPPVPPPPSTPRRW